MRNRVTARRGFWWLRARLPRRARHSDAADTPTVTRSRMRRSGYAVCTLENAVPEPEYGNEAFEGIGPQTRAESEHEQHSREQAFRQESSLTNEVQRRAKRVRCNAGLGRPCIGLAGTLRPFARPGRGSYCETLLARSAGRRPGLGQGSSMAARSPLTDFAVLIEQVLRTWASMGDRIHGIARRMVRRRWLGRSMP